MTKDKLIEIFPHLKNYRITSPEDYRYNCIAWAANDTKHWWQPAESPYFFWLHADKNESLESYVKVFNILGYKETSDSPDLEAEFEKIALYIDADGLPSHAARQLNNGKWTSKLGELEDIEHETLESLEGEAYGKVKIILKRPSKNVSNPN